MQTEGSVTVVDGRYELEVELGRGRTGMVWRARDIVLGRSVALKIVHPSLADDPRFIAALADEVRRLASVDAPGLARLFDTGEEDVPYLVHRLVEGENLRAFVARQRRPAVDETTRIATGVLHALARAHEAGAFHLNLALEDVIVTPAGGTVVTDLALGPAVVASRAAEDAASMLGPDVAPEIHAGNPPDARTDVWGVGALLFEALSGERPAGRRSVRALRDDVPRWLDRAISRALAPEPDERFADALAFADALSMPEHDDDPGRRGVVRTWFAVPLLVGVVAVIVIAAGIWLGQLEVGGPLGIRSAREPDRTTSPAAPATAPQMMRPVAATVFDPLGDGSENSSTAPAAIDGDDATAWRSEAYRYPDGGLGKDGVGLVFDLGEARDVRGFRLTTPHPGYAFQVAVGEDPDALLDALGPPLTAEASSRGELMARGRYVLVWVTSVVDAGDGDRAEIAEFRAVVAIDA